MKKTIPLILSILLAVAFQMEAAPQKAYTPAPGTPQRQEIMDFCRVDFYGNLPDARRNPQNIKMVVSFLKTNGEWFCAHISPTINGKEVAEPRWVLAHKNNNQWQGIDLINLLQPKDDPEASDILDFQNNTSQRIKAKLPRAANVLPN